MKSNIFEQITSEIDKFENETIHIADGYDLNTSNLINKILFILTLALKTGRKTAEDEGNSFIILSYSAGIQPKD